MHCAKTSLPLLVAIGAAALAQNPELRRWTIDAGGSTRSSGGNLELSGTIGQPDAGFSAGHTFELTGGFWFAALPADCDDDGIVGSLDQASLVQCLTGPAGVVAAGCECTDAFPDGSIDLRDVASAQVLGTLR